MRRLSKILLAATGLAAVMVSPAAHAVLIVHSNDVLGELEPCGCRSNPQGGLGRRANLLSRLAQQGKGEILQLDAGDLLFPSATIAPLLEAQAELQAGFMIKGLEKLGQDAVTPGEKDFALGLKTFRKLTQGSKVKFLAANLKPKKGKPIFEGSAIFERKDAAGKKVRVAVIGLVGTDLKWPGELKALPPIPAAKAEVAKLRKRADYVVALTHHGLEEDEKLAKAVPGIDLIIGGHSQAFLQAPKKAGSTVILQSSFRNQYIGVIPLAKPLAGEGYQLLGMDAAYDSPAEAPNALDQLVNEAKTSITALNTRQENLLVSASDAEAAARVPKFQTFPKCAECHLKQFDFWRKTKHAMAFQALMGAQSAKNKECLDCHTVGLGDPEGISNLGRLAEARRLDEIQGQSAESGGLSLEEVNAYLKAMTEAKDLNSTLKISEADPEPRTLRDSLARLQNVWTPVQCENCHAPGRNHPFSAGYSKKVEDATCLKCHDLARAPAWYGKENAPSWDAIKEKRSLVACPPGELAPTE